MIDVSRVIGHPALMQPFTVLRSSGSFIGGVWTESPSQSIPMQGIVYPSTNKELLQLPEGDRSTSMMTFLSTQTLYITHSSGTPGTSDLITWRGDTYRMVSAFEL